jgi:hypothetical protein
MFRNYRRNLRNSRILSSDAEYKIMSPIPPICQLRANSPVVKSSIKPRFRDAIEAVVAGYVLRRLTRQPLRHLQAIKILDRRPRKHVARRHASLAALFQLIGFPPLLQSYHLDLQALIWSAVDALPQFTRDRLQLL